MTQSARAGGTRPAVSAPAVPGTWRDPALPVADRVADLLGRLTMAEKLAQLGSVWIGAADEDGIAPMQDEFGAVQLSLDELIASGIGQLTRVFGTRPVEPAAAMRTLAELQARDRKSVV